MDIWLVASISLVFLLTLSVILWLLFKFQSRMLGMQQQQSIQSLTLQGQNQHDLVVALDKAMALIASRDALTFQQLQMMNGASYDDTTEKYDPSDEGEYARIHGKNPDLAEEGDLNAYERDIIGDIGVDPEFLFPQ